MYAYDSPLSVLSVCNGVANDVLQEDLEDTAGLLVNETRDTLHTTTASETADSLHKALAKGERRAKRQNARAW